MNFTTLTADATTQGSIKYAINYSRIDSAGILAEAEAWIYQRLRIFEMLKSADIAISSAASTATRPADYLDPIHLGIPGIIPRIKLKDHEWFRTNLAWDSAADLPSGVPTYWADIGGVINFNTKADQAYTAKMLYFARPDALSGSNETNWLTDRYPTLLRRVCTMYAAEARKEYDTMDRSELRALQDIQEIKKESDMQMRGLELDFHWESN